MDKIRDDSFIGSRVSVKNRGMIYATATITVLFGIAEFVPSVILLNSSEQFFVGGIYVAVFMMVTGVFLFFKMPPLVFQGILAVNALAALLAAILQGVTYGELSSVEACAIYSTTTSTSCNGLIMNYHCYGDKDYFTKAQHCSADYKNGMKDNTCVCARTGTSDCLAMPHFDNCDELFHYIPHVLLISFIWAIILAVFTIIIAVWSYFQNPYEDDNVITHMAPPESPARLLREKEVKYKPESPGEDLEGIPRPGPESPLSTAVTRSKPGFFPNDITL